LRLLITGASGVLGRSLVPMLTTGGHQVTTLVRRPPDKKNNEIFWDPEQNILPGGDLPELDGVIHLAGEYIGLNRWTERQKQRVLTSRIRGTNLLAKTLATLPRPPRVLASASAIGFYGDCGDRLVDESTPPGKDFLSEVCARWEQAAAPAAAAGIRTTLLRLGVGLTPRGGALARTLAASPIGLMRRLGSGHQYLSWIGCDDLIAAILHTLVSPSLSGPVNIAAPNPVTNREFLRTLAAVTGKPLLLPLPARLLQILYGQMAREILLSSCRVSGKKLADSGFVFRHPNLDGALRFLLGKTESA
jgi:hypothetical protein